VTVIIAALEYSEDIEMEMKMEVEADMQLERYQVFRVSFYDESKYS
jgi:hypothetical protein